MSAMTTLHLWMRRAALALSAAWLFTAPLAASFDEVGAGARGAGMADAQTAVADDASAAFNNPAGLVQVGDRRLATEFSQFARGLTDGSKLSSSLFSYVHPVKPGQTVLSAGYRSFNVSDILTEKTYLLGAGQRLNVAPFGWEGVWSAGANLKMLQRSFVTDAFASNAIADNGAASGQADPILANGAKKSAYSVDVGVMYQFGRQLDSSIGLTVLNANKPNLGVSSNDHAPEIIKIGAAHRPKWGVITAEVRHAYRLTGAPDTDVAFGAERNFRLSNYSAVVLRGGYAEGSRGYQAVTAGAAYHFGRYSFDYAFSFPIGNLSQTDGSQRIGFSMRFGLPASTATVKAPIMPPLLEPGTQMGSNSEEMTVVTSSAAAQLEGTSNGMKEFKESVEENVATLQREIDALRKAASVAASTPTAVPPVVAPVQPTPSVTPIAQPTAPAAPAPVVAPAPVAPPVITPPAPVTPKRVKQPTPMHLPAPRVSRPPTSASAPSSEAAKAWTFYQEAVDRDVSDSEKIEILESMLLRFGENEAGRLNVELEKLRRRATKPVRGR